jgi:hypothetical protein
MTASPKDVQERTGGLSMVIFPAMAKLQATDPSAAFEILQQWQGFLKGADSYGDQFETLDAYIPYRLINAGTT